MDVIHPTIVRVELAPQDPPADEPIHERRHPRRRHIQVLAEHRGADAGMSADTLDRARLEVTDTEHFPRRDQGISARVDIRVESVEEDR
ncbi:predicted metal-binding, possibly nucleic acid-binding protein [Microbacterium testaceum StLB037]|uniref:Predicted metal-binding, possibly nucleic acid-binding protein n=1 Tax=Microbacterium testaceum (strain StLB037) TaxID=979556 RepID=E8NGP1_MICTS|nr:predicted metal-binding, possibly nucleic acid-binding protein [Microbacterium testaceum StLB037]